MTSTRQQAEKFDERNLKRLPYVAIVRDGFINLVRPFQTGYSPRRTFHGFAPSAFDITDYVFY